MKRIFRCIAAFLFLFYILFLSERAESANASVYHNLRNYTVDDGLSSNHVYGIVQDSVGFIWFGTDNGLCRFDGCEFPVTPIPMATGRAFRATISAG